MKATHSPGPWYRDDLLAPNGRPVIARTAGRIPISATTDDWLGYPGEDEANAQLIAAAPRLLKVLAELHHAALICGLAGTHPAMVEAAEAVAEATDESMFTTAA